MAWKCEMAGYSVLLGPEAGAGAGAAGRALNTTPRSLTCSHNDEKIQHGTIGSGGTRGIPGSACECVCRGRVTVVVVRGLDGPETREEWVLSCDGSLKTGGVSEFGSWCRTWDSGDQDGGLITRWVLWFLFGSLVLMLQKASNILPRLSCLWAPLSQGPGSIINLD